MNAAARAISHGNLFKGDLPFSNIGITPVLTIILWIAVIASAVGVVYVKNLERHYVHQITQVNHKNDQVAIQKAQLLLGKSMWSSPARIRRLAGEHLNMRQAKSEALIVIKR